MSKPANNVLPYVISFVAGLAICLYITGTSGRREAWDAPEYFTIGIPAMCLVIFVLAYFFPQRAWRWALSMAIGQSVAMVLGGGSASLWPLAIIAMTVVSLPQFIVAMIAGSIAKKRAQPDDAPEP
jgi:RsiW-degrading membrane proteinase PrsW (M82 family)